MSQNSWKKIGKVGKAHGLKGAFYLAGRNRALKPVYSEVLVGPEPGKAISCKITGQKEHNQRTILSLSSFKDRTALELYTGQWIWAAADIFESPAEALEGVPCEDSCGAHLGLISGFYNHGASDIIEITSATGKCLEIPFVETYVDTAAAGKPEILKLRVPADTFYDLWS